jgi:hypothetical protein
MNENSRDLHIRITKEENRQLRYLMDALGERASQVISRSLNMMYETVNRAKTNLSNLTEENKK